MDTAIKIKDLTGFRGQASLYKLSRPIPAQYTFDDEKEGTKLVETTEYVVVSAAVFPYSGPETSIFPSNEEGVITSWGELNGSYRGGLDHYKALIRAGFFVVEVN